MGFRFFPHLIFAVLVSCSPQANGLAQTEPTEQGRVTLDYQLFQSPRPYRNLDGEWEFYWKKFLEPGSTQEPDAYLFVPSVWNKSKVRKEEIGGMGYGTYRLKILIPNEQELQLLREQIVALKLADVGTSYSIYFNGQLLKKVGTVGKSEEEAVSRYEPDLVVLPNTWKLENELLLHISNFKHARGGLWESIHIGNFDSLLQMRIRNLFIAVFLIGGMTLIGLYHLGLFVLRTKDKSNLYFGLFCLIISIRTFLTGEMLFAKLLPVMPWDFTIKLEYLSLSFGVTSFLSFLRSIFQKEIPKTLSNIVLQFSNLLTAIVLFFPVVYFSQILQIFQLGIMMTFCLGLYGMAKSILVRAPGSLSFFIGFLVFGLIIVNDILHTNGTINTGYYGTFGFSFFVFSQALFLSMRSSRAFLQVEELTETLELKVEQRTKDLEVAQRATEELNSLLKSLNDELEIQQIMNKVLDFVKRNFGIEHYALFRADTEKTYLQCVSITFPEFVDLTSRDSIMEMKFPIGKVRGANAFALLAKKPIYWPKVKKTGVTKEELFIIEVGKLESYLMIPLLLGNQPIGILHFYNQGQMELSKFDLNKLSILGEHIAGIIHGSNLYNQIQEEKFIAIYAQKEAEEIKNEIIQFNNFSKKLNSLVHLDLILDHMFGYMIDSFEIDYVNYYNVNPENRTISFVRASSKLAWTESLTPKLMETSISLSKELSIQGLVYEKKRHLYIPQIRKSIRESDNYFMEIMKNDNILILPLVINQNVIGMFHIINYNQKTFFRRNQINRFSRFAEQISIAINNAYLIKEIRHTSTSLEKLNEITRKVNSSEDLEVILKVIYDYLKFEYNISIFWLVNLDPIQKDLYSSHLFGVENSEFVNQLINMRIPLTPESGTLYRTFTKKKTFYLPRINRKYLNKLDIFIADALDLDSLLQLPLIVGDEVIGILCFTKKELILSKNQINDIVRFGDHVAGALHNSFLLNDTRLAQKVAADRNEVILKSISYAKTIQDSILPENQFLNDNLKEHFLVWKPRDMVGGDLYWSRSTSKAIYLGVIDCIGHGVPGAFITMLCQSMLNRITDSKEDATPAEVLEELDFYIKESVHRNKSSTNPDVSLEMGLCKFAPSTRELVFSGSKISLHYEKEGRIAKIEGTNKAIGDESKKNRQFQNQSMIVPMENYFYLFTDGMYSQMGEDKNFPIGRTNFISQLESSINQSSEIKKSKLLDFYESYKGNEEQIDDITVLGFKL